MFRSKSLLKKLIFFKPTLLNKKFKLKCNQQSILLYSTFVSKHFQLNSNEIIEFLDKSNMIYRKSGEEIVVKECPFCHETKGKLENQYKLYVHK
jgi:hypothetical protein